MTMAEAQTKKKFWLKKSIGKKPQGRAKAPKEPKRKE